MTHRPRCPNHLVELDPTDNLRIGICPISGARFQVDVDVATSEIKLNKDGHPIHQLTVVPLDGVEG
jgi:hypothetical protein